MTISPQRLLILGALNQRGIRGQPALMLLRHYSQARIARQIDYYDFEISSPAGLQLPRWAASPWLWHRIKRDALPPPGFYSPAAGILDQLRAPTV